MAAWRFVNGAGSAMFFTGAVSFIALISTPHNRGRLMSLQIGSLLLGTDIGPIIGGVIADHFGFRWPFYIAGIISAVAATGILIKLREVPERDGSSMPQRPETKGQQNRKMDFRTIHDLLANPTFLILCIFTLLVFFTRSGSRQTLMPLLAVDKVGMSATQLGFLFFLMTTMNLILAIMAGALTDRFGRKAMILPGAFLTMMGLSFFAWTTTIPSFFGAAFLLGLGTGVIGPTPAAYAGDMAPPGKTGTTMGLYRTFGDLGLIIGPLLLGWISDAFDRQFGNALGESVAMEFNAILLLLTASLLTWVGIETAGRRR
jgi:MFS family permease